MDWVKRALVCNGAVVAEPLDPGRLTDADLRSICQRMHAILNTVETPRCEGRLLPVKLFDAIDTLASLVRHGPKPHLAEWASVISEFGSYYELTCAGPIGVEPADWRDAGLLVGAASDAEPPFPPDPARDAGS